MALLYGRAGCLTSKHGVFSARGQSGSGASVAAALTALAVGSETDGSIVGPSCVNGVVGVKPTVGLLSRHGIIPISAVCRCKGFRVPSIHVGAS
jgi:Asp-tRNA(Asn)/Glu-tRNA(Gln) amidotransferase A subunit family amidase